MDISVLVPLYNEAESLPVLHDWIVRVMKEHQFSYEILFVNDGSTDDSWAVIKALQAKDTNVKGICFRRNYGKSAALHCGFQAVQGDVVITMDADLQDSPDEIPELYRMVKQDGYDLVSGWKQKRYDNKLTKNLPSKLFNATARRVTGIKLHDMNCGHASGMDNVQIRNRHQYEEQVAKQEPPFMLGNPPVNKQRHKEHHAHEKLKAQITIGINQRNSIENIIRHIDNKKHRHENHSAVHQPGSTH